MNGLIVIKTTSPLHLFLNKFIGYQSVGFIVEDKIYLIDEFGLYEHNFTIGVELEIFKQYYLIQSLQILEIKDNRYWKETVFANLIINKSSVADIIGYIVRNRKDNVIYNIDIVYKILLKLSPLNQDFNILFKEWKVVPLPLYSEKQKRIKQEEIDNLHKPKLKQCLSIVADLIIENPNYFVNPYKIICDLLFQELDKPHINKSKILEIKKLYYKLENL